MGWVQLDQETAAEFIRSVENPDFPGLFSAHLSEVHAQNLSFFRDTRHVVLENHGIAPALSLEFLVSGPHTAYLDGGTGPFEEFCALGLLMLNPGTVIDYLEFHCRHAVERPNNIFLLKNTDKMPYRGDYYLDFQFDKNNYSEKDIILSRNESNSGYIVQAPFVFDGKIDPATAYIADNGVIEIHRREGL